MDIKNLSTPPKVGDYLVGKSIGTGSFSVVKLGTHDTSGEIVSLLNKAIIHR
jgi:hypothetical protein